MNPTASPQTPTRVRYGVLGFCCVLSMITYLDRVCFGTIAPFIQREFALTASQIGYIFGAFTFAYAVLEVPSGWLGDKFGPRKTLIRIVIWWSVFTMFTGMISANGLQFWIVSLSPFALMLTVRFLFGAGEAGAYPNIARAFHNWFPFGERGFAKGAVWMAGRFAGGVTPFIVLLLLFEAPDDTKAATTAASTAGLVAAPMGIGPFLAAPIITPERYITTHWRHTFYIFGGLGLVWCVLFWYWFRDRPEEKSGVNQAEIDLIHAGDATHGSAKLSVPWGKLLTSGNLWLLCFMYFCASFGWYFNITYLPGFLEDQFGLVRGQKFTAGWWSFSIMAGLPLLLGSVACLLGGLLTDWVIKRTGNRKWGRRLFGLIGHGMCAICYFVGVYIIWSHPDRSGRGLGTAWMFVLAIAFAAFWNDMTMGSSWASCLDIGGKFSGIVAGCMNTIGNLGGFVANILTGWVLDHYLVGLRKGTPEYFTASQPAWMINLVLSGTVYIIAVFLWMRFDSTKPVAPGATGLPIDDEPMPD